MRVGVTTINAHILIKVARWDFKCEELFIKMIVTLMEVLCMVVLMWTVVARWSLMLEWMVASVCGCAMVLLVGGGKVLVEAQERHGKVLSNRMHLLLG